LLSVEKKIELPTSNINLFFELPSQYCMG